MKSKLFSAIIIIGICCFSSILANEFSNQQVIEKIATYGQNELGWPILHYAVKMRDTLVVQTLLEAGVDAGVNVICRTKSTVHSSGSSNGYYKNDGYTPIEIAVQGRNTEMVSILLDHGADPYLMRTFDITSNRRGYYSALWVAIQNKDYETLKTLVAHRIDFNRICVAEQDKESLSGYYVACASCDTRIIGIILGM